MIVVLSATNRPGSNTRRVAQRAQRILLDTGRDTTLLSLEQLPAELFDPTSYTTKPDSFKPIEQTILGMDGMLVVTPEYNGSFPGVLKYFIDMLPFPASLVDKPAGFIGLAAGQWGALRAVEQLELIFHYRQAHLYGQRLFLPRINQLLDADGNLTDPELAARLTSVVEGFGQFCDRFKGQPSK